MTPRERIWFSKTIGAAPYEYQERLMDDVSRFTVVNKSRRTGISTIYAFKALRNAMRGKTSLIISASERQSIFVMTEYVERFLKSLPMAIVLKEDSKSVKRFDNGGVIYSLPNQSNTIRGFNADFVVLDEAAHFLNDTDKLVYEAISPMLALGGSMAMVSTPFGDQNIFARMWRDPNNGYSKTTINWRECQRLSADIETTKRAMDEITFDQEFNNVFRGEVDSEFPMSLLERAVDQEMQYEVNASGDAAGADIGRRRDLSAVCIIRKQGDIRRLVEKHVWSGVPFEEQQNRMLEMSKRVGVLRIDQGGMGEAPAEWLMARASNVQPILFTNEIKTEMFLGLKRLLEQGKLQFPFDPRLIASLQSVRRYYRLGRVIIDAERTDETGHADEATALALACWEVPRRQVNIAGIWDEQCPRCQGKGCHACNGRGTVPHYAEF